MLDVGCGTGELLARLAAKYPEACLAGLDPVPAMLQQARPWCDDYLACRLCNLYCV